MQIGFKYHNCAGFGRLYNYGLKHFNPYTMITKEAEQRLKIILFWKKHGLKAVEDAFGAKRSTLFCWWKIYVESGRKIESLNPGSQARKANHKREIHPELLKEIRRLRLEICPNMGKEKVKKYLDIFSERNDLPIYSESKIGRIIKDKKIYHHRQKVSHFGQVKIRLKEPKKRKPDDFKTKMPGDLVEIDTVVKFAWNIKRYIITAVDVHSRYSFAFCYERPQSINARDFIQKLMAVFPYPIKAVQTDNGSEFHKFFRDYLKEQKITQYWNYPGRPYRQGHIEKFNRTIQEEFIDWNEVLLDDANIFNQKLTEWLIWYNTKRYHWSLNLTSPVDYLINNGYLSKMSWTNTRFFILLIGMLYY
jgi:transposase InsO family protein